MQTKTDEIVRLTARKSGSSERNEGVTVSAHVDFENAVSSMRPGTVSSGEVKGADGVMLANFDSFGGQLNIRYSQLPEGMDRSDILKDVEDFIESAREAGTTIEQVVNVD